MKVDDWLTKCVAGRLTSATCPSFPWALCSAALTGSGSAAAAGLVFCVWLGWLPPVLHLLSLPFEVGEESFEPAKLLVCMQQWWWGGFGGDRVCVLVIVASELLFLLLEMDLPMACGKLPLSAWHLCVLEDGLFVAACPQV